jgi:DNA-directed RNA polymerase specialized sigma24 family protein
MSSQSKDKSFGRMTEYASADDFCRVFNQDMDVLYWLALTLTGDETKAEQCFVSGLEECLEGNSVFKDWARSWSKRVVIKNAIRLVSPRPGMTTTPPSIHAEPESQAETAMSALKAMRPFDRFVFVMSVLEGYTDRDCAILLGCSPSDLVKARFRAVQEIARAIKASAALPKMHGNEFQENGVANEVRVA